MPWNDVIVAYRNNGPLRVRDIGAAVAGPEDAKQAAWADGKRGVFLVIFGQPGANVINTVERIIKALPHLKEPIPPAITISPCPTAPRPSAPRCTTCSSPCCSPSRWW